MSLTRTAVARPIGTGIICGAIVLVGMISVRKLAVDLLPEVDFPRISVVTQYAGVGPEEIETLITRPIEQTVATIDGVRSIESVSAEGLSRVQLQFAWGIDLETAVNDVRAYLDRLGNQLPDDAERPVVYKFDLSSVPVAQIGLSGGGDPRRLRYVADQILSRRLERVPGVAAVTVRGGRVREIRVELDSSRLVSLGVSASEVIAALARDNRNVSAGDMVQTGREVLVRSVGEWTNPDEIRDTLVAVRDQRSIYVRDVAEVRDTFQEVRSELWVDGQPGITLRVSKQSDANTVTVVDELRTEIERINRDYDGRLTVTLLSNAADYIERAITNVRSSALFGAVLAIVVLLFFLRDVRATLLIGIAIPISVVATFALMYFAGFTLNVISFGGLALGIGMLVDNAIVILENIYRKREGGLSGAPAAIEGAREVGPAVIAGTVTTIAVFAPVVFLAGFTSVLFKEMAAVVTFALACSLLVALTLVPSLAALWLRRRPARSDRFDQRISRGVERRMAGMEAGYGRLVGAAVRAPWFVLACAVLLLVASARLVSVVGFELMPETDEGEIDVDFDLPIGTPVERTAVVVKEFEKRVREVVTPEELETVESSAGPENWWRPGGGHQGQLEIHLVQVAQRDRGIDEIMAGIRAAVSGVPGTSIRMRKGTSNFLMRLMRGSTGERLVVEIRGHDLATAAALGEQVEKLMTEIPGIADVRVDREQGLEERTIHVDAARAADVGLTRAEVADTIEVYVLGRVATRLRDSGDEFDVRVLLRDQERQQLERLATLPLITRAGVAVPLASVATIGGRRGPTSISREGQERVLKVFGGLADRPLSAVVADLRAGLRRVELPEGFTLAVAGEQEQQEESFSGLTVGIVLAILLVFAVMAVQFESLRHPLVVMAAIPFGGIGVIVTLVITGTTFNMNSFLGAIVLVGIAVNNAIVLVDYINMLRREQGFELEAAVIEAGRRRLRPILMTSLTTALAMLPLALALGEGSELQAPLARVVVGGLIASTMVTLVLVPSLYYLVERRRPAGAVVVAGGEPTPPHA